MAQVKAGDVFFIEKGMLKVKRGASTSEVDSFLFNDVVSFQRVVDDELIVTKSDAIIK